MVRIIIIFNRIISNLFSEGKGEENEAREITKSKFIGTDHNPFKYDSSDSEDEVEENKVEAKKEPISIQNIVKKENFFFVLNDERLQGKILFSLNFL